MNGLILLAVLANPIVLEVPGLTCPTCVAPVKKALALVEGVEKVEIDWRTRKVSISVTDKSKLDRGMLAQILKKAGFPPTATAQTVGTKTKGDLGDVLLIKAPPKSPDRLSVWGKVTIVGVCTPNCAPCDVLKRDLTLFAQRVKAIAVRLVVVDGPKHPAAAYLPARAEIPYAYVYDTIGQRRYAGGAAGQIVYRTAEEILGVKK